MLSTTSVTVERSMPSSRAFWSTSRGVPRVEPRGGARRPPPGRRTPTRHARSASMVERIVMWRTDLRAGGDLATSDPAATRRCRQGGTGSPVSHVASLGARLLERAGKRRGHKDTKCQVLQYRSRRAVSRTDLLRHAGAVACRGRGSTAANAADVSSPGSVGLMNPSSRPDGHVDRASPVTSEILSMWRHLVRDSTHRNVAGSYKPSDM